MNKTFVALVLGLILLGIAAPATALQAVARVVESPWYTTNKAARFGNASLTDFYAPLPVFFEGWESTPRSDITDFRWSIDDGPTLFHGFNYVHVFEVPREQPYKVTLTVEDASGATATADVFVKVRARDGRTFYVDAQAGNDANDGLTPQTAWRTATFAFNGMNNKRYLPGDQILFKRGQTFDMAGTCVTGTSFNFGYGYLFSTYGEGARPILQYTDTVAKRIFNISKEGMAHITWQDLVFECTSASGVRSLEFFNSTGSSTNLMWLRCDINRMQKAIIFDEGSTVPYGTNVISGIFIVNCKAYDAELSQFYAHARRYALVNNYVDFGGMHMCYLSALDIAFIAGNTLTRPAFGRTGLRIAGLGGPDHPTEHVWVSNNSIIGWIDPRTLADGPQYSADGTRYNYSITNPGPNVFSKPHYMRDVVFEHNLVTNAETLLQMGSYEDLVVRDNVFRTESNYVGGIRINFGSPLDNRPLKNITFIRNTIISAENRTSRVPTISVDFELVKQDGTVKNTWEGVPYTGVMYHQNLKIQDNVIVYNNGSGRFIWIENPTADDINNVLSDRNTIYTTATDGLFKLGGDYLSGGTLLDLTQWRNQTGKDANTVLVTNTKPPIPGECVSPPQVAETTFNVGYSGASDVNGGGLAEVRLWVRKDLGPWTPTDYVGTGPSGTFSFQATQGDGAYYFGTQAKDNNGRFSYAPAGNGSSVTILDSGAPPPAPPAPDTTPPVAGVASSPATADTAIPVNYTGASDEGGSGLAEVRLWVRKDAGDWQETAHVSPASSGSFNFSGMTGSGRYYFATRAKDGAGNLSPAPSADGNTFTDYTETAPTPPPPPPAPSGDLPAGVVMDLRMDDNPTDGALDSSGLNNHGVMASAGETPTLVDGAYQFDGVNDFIDIRAVADDIPSGFTLSMWLNAPAIYTTRKGAVVSYIDAAGADKMQALVGDGTNGSQNNKILVWTGSNRSSNTVAADATWHQFAYSYSGGAAKIYVDGALKLSYAVTLAQATTDIWSLGQEYDGGGTRTSDWYQGLMDDVIFWNRALADDEVNTVFTLGRRTGGEPPAPTDTTPPNPGTLTAPASNSNAASVSLTYSGASDDSSGLKEVRLWSRKDGGAWADTGLASASASGSFTFNFPADGMFDFAIRAQDNAGNFSGDAGAGQVVSTRRDTAPPNAGTMTALAAMTAANSVQIQYSGASDTASGLKEVRLWTRKDGGAWTDSGQFSANASATLTFNFPSDGNFDFSLRAQDNAGNFSGAAGAGQVVSTQRDTTAPNPGTPSSPQYASGSSISVSYSGASDAGSGLKTVKLWVKRGTGAFNDTGLTNSTASGTFTYTGVSENTTYTFGLQAEDNAGNVSATPTSGSSTIYDGATPSPATVSSPEFGAQGGIPVTYSVDTMPSSGLKQVILWARKGTGAWTNTGITGAAPSGTINYTGMTGDDTYQFAVQVENNAGGKSPAPSGASPASTKFDSTPPADVALTAPEFVTSGTINVSYSGASDPVSGLKSVELWAKKGTGAWASAGMTSTAASHTFNYNGMTGNGVYAFALRLEDNAGNKSPEPSGGGAVSTTYDGAAVEPASTTAPEFATQNPIQIAYTVEQTFASGVKSVRLFAKQGSAAWADTGQTSSAISGSFNFTAPADATYRFEVQVENNAGGKSPAPTTGTSTTIFDTTAPAAITPTAPQYATGGSVQVAYSGAADAGSGLLEVRLWARKGAQFWADTGQVSTNASGSFTYNGFTGDATYRFLTQVVDKAGNVSEQPSGDVGAAVVYDSTAPVPGVATAPQTANPSASVTVGYSGAQDTLSGLKDVALWVSKNGTWSDSGQKAPAASGSFNYTLPAGDGVYGFALRATDNAGNQSPQPSGPGDAITTVDGTPPTLGSMSASAAADSQPIPLLYSGVTDTGSGLKEVRLWAKKGTGGQWAATGDVSAGGSGSFGYTGMTGDDTYFFAIQAEDNAGNTTPEPSGAGMASVVYSTNFSPGTAVAPEFAKAGPITITYSGAQDTSLNGGIASVALWFKKGSAGTWQDSGLSSTGASGSFNFNQFSGQDTYYFATRATNNRGEQTPEPFGAGHTQTILDSTPPNPGTLSAPAFTKKNEVTLTYSGVSDTGSGLKEVRLWVKLGDTGAWQDTGLKNATGSGQFVYRFTGKQGKMYFVIQSFDKVDNSTPQPTDAIVFGQ